MTAGALLGAATGAALVLALSCTAAALSTPRIGDAPHGSAGQTDAGFAAVTPGRPLEFPRDYGSHPDFRTEWWYVTGWLSASNGEELGFQITFFRTKPVADPANTSAFTPRQLLIAHCAVSDPKRGRLWQDQKISRAGMGLAEAATDDANVWIDGWSLRRDSGAYRAVIAADGFALALTMQSDQPPMPNGESGLSRKGPSAAAASYYYSLPHLQVSGAVARGGMSLPVSGEAWFDHEWSSEYLDGAAQGWDWVGLNLDSGAALMAFRIRAADGSTRWAGGSYRSPTGVVQVFEPAAIAFRAQRIWTSPRTRIQYPVEWRITVGAHEFVMKPLMDDQENDTRLSTGAIYWEGAVRAYDYTGAAPSAAPAALAGKGYLELTGYGERLRLP